MKSNPAICEYGKGECHRKAKCRIEGDDDLPFDQYQIWSLVVCYKHAREFEDYERIPLVKHWYKTIIATCPMCGRNEKYRFRVYEEKERGNEFKEQWDYCDQ
jgi:hypothetical protein